MKTRLLMFALLGCTSLIVAGRVGSQIQPQAKIVSLVQLIANPDKYDGKRINVKGFLHLESEGNILYLSAADYRNGIEENGVWVDINNEMNANRAELSDKYIQLLGTFSIRKMGGMLGAGSITHIVKASVWSDPEHPRTERSAIGRVH